MCSEDHSLPVMTALPKGEFAVRVLQHGSEIGLTPEVIEEVAASSRRWKATYIPYAEQISALGTAIDLELCEYSVDVARVKELAQSRRQLIGELEEKYVETWAKTNAIMSEDEYDKLFSIYRSEFKNLPHPVLGTDAREILPAEEVALT